MSANDTHAIVTRQRVVAVGVPTIGSTIAAELDATSTARTRGPVQAGRAPRPAARRAIASPTVIAVADSAAAARAAQARVAQRERASPTMNINSAKPMSARNASVGWVAIDRARSRCARRRTPAAISPMTIGGANAASAAARAAGRAARPRRSARACRSSSAQNTPASRPAAIVMPSSWQRSSAASSRSPTTSTGGEHRLPPQAGDDALDAADRAVAVVAALHEQRVRESAASRRAARSRCARRSPSTRRSCTRSSRACRARCRRTSARRRRSCRTRAARAPRRRRSRRRSRPRSTASASACGAARTRVEDDEQMRAGSATGGRSVLAREARRDRT